ncbi:uncharacterized protein E5676_scaffold315G00780 [Cucumis melo var. makuwa]|uniref:Retrotransposon gag domain-containing protein n=1 Tax=Cucumis melo var. makuwa TaxID=1194695 RepID=A0A5A7TFV5_CUCMM|nr:uncharacterized protein E6C27_scaffold125G00500 [Cucumis melo var. makuwa]TYK10611.1 uncharacterized protein E5676_scaffold315G00780 [Cucumis melo var. makuwa]
MVSLSQVREKEERGGSNRNLGRTQRAMRKRFVPKHYERDLKTKLQSLTHGTKSVAEYYREMETLIGRARIQEGEEDTMSRFLGGLNQEIAHLVDRNPPYNMEDMYHYAIKIEAQLKEEKERSKRNESMQSRGKFVAAKKVEVESSNTKKVEASKEVSEKTSSIQYECEENDAQLEEEYETPVDDEYIEEGNSISPITRRVLNVKIKEEKIEDQRENLFLTRCLIEGSPCSLVIDNGSCTNAGEVRNMFSFKAANFVLMCKGKCLENEPNSNDGLPSTFKSLLEEFNDMFPYADAPTGLPPLRGIKH